MSYKAYLFALPSAEHVDILDHYLKEMDWPDSKYSVAYLSYFYKLEKGWNKTYTDGLVLAAITVDRGDLWDSLYNETKSVPQEKGGYIPHVPKFVRLEDVPRRRVREKRGKEGRGFRLTQAEIIEIEDEKNWAIKIKEMMNEVE